MELARLAGILVLLAFIFSCLGGYASMFIIARTFVKGRSNFDRQSATIVCAAVMFLILGSIGLQSFLEVVRFQEAINRELRPVKEEFRRVAEDRLWGSWTAGEEWRPNFAGELDKVVQKRNKILATHEVIMNGVWHTRQLTRGSKKPVEFDVLYIPKGTLFWYLYRIFSEPVPSASPASAGLYYF